MVADRIPDARRFDLVAVDNAASAGAVVRHLGEQGIGDCLVVGTSLRISTVRERWEGAMAAAGAMRIEFMAVGFDDHAPLALADRMRTAPPEALFCLDHETTLAVYVLLRELGVCAGSDVAFASFDEKEWMRLVAPGVTAVRQPVEEMAECAWTMLRRRIAGDAGPPLTRRLRCAVTFRGSTKARDAARRSEPSRAR